MPATEHSLKAHMGEGTASFIHPATGEPAVSVNIDGHQLRVPRDITIMEAALSHGIEIPHFCYHPGLTPEGNCRMCLVEIAGRPKLEPSCIIPVGDDMVVYTHSDAVVEARRAIMEFLLLNHPLDCPWCDKAGECMLQDNAYRHGSGRTRHQMLKHTWPVKDFGPKLKMYMNRCIQCTRCVRFLSEVDGGEEFSLFQRGADVDVGTYISHSLASNYQVCLADICPVGALVTKPFLYRARVFYLESQQSVCPLCSAGCSIYVDRYFNRVARMRPRPNPEVNDWWMCDRGRFETEWFQKDRIVSPALRTEGTLADGSWQAALDAAATALQAARGGKVGGIVSAGASCEEIYLFNTLIRGLAGHLSPWYGPGGRIDPAAKIDFLYRRDPNANTRGLEAVVTDLVELDSLLQLIEGGGLTTLVVLGRGLDEATAGRLAGLEQLIVISSHRTPAVTEATVVLPGAVWVEKNGTYVNGDGHLQRFNRAVDIATRAKPETTILARLIERCGLGTAPHDPASIFNELGRQRGPFAGLSWEQIPPNGCRIELQPRQAESGPSGSEATSDPRPETEE